MNLISTCDLVITAAYFSIPLQILVALWKSPPTRTIPLKLVITLILFAFFIFLCGTGHLMRYMDYGHTTAFIYVNVATALVSTVTALYLIPLIPCLFSLLDDALNKLTNESKESKSKLFTFMAFLCHEIRNPLFAITSSADFLSGMSLNDEQEEEVSSIRDSSLLMLRLVNDVLDLSKLDSGKLELEAREFDLHSLLRRLGENMTRQVARKHKNAVQMSFDMTHEVPQVIIGDSCRILQIVYNLLSNSCKFTSQGKIQLTVRLANEAAERQEQDAARKAGAHTVTMSSDRPVAMLSANDGAEEVVVKTDDDKNLFSMALLDCDANAATDIEAGDSGNLLPKNPNESIMVLSITVADTGIGIPTERLKNIFEPYTQAKLSDFRQHGGTGLGLSIISSLMKTMGGSISVTSKYDEGARFHLKIPVRVPHQPLNGDNDEDHMGDQSDNHFLESRRLPVYEDVIVSSNNTASTSSTPSEDEEAPSPLNSPKKTTALFTLGSPLQQDNKIKDDASSSLMPDLLDSSSASSTAAPLPGLQRRVTRERSSPPPPAVEALPGFEFAPRSNVVLVVDDNSVNRKILGKMLKGYKLEYETACNGQEAVDTMLASRNAHPGDLSRPQFGLVFMDVSMPVMDGNVAIKTIRKAKIDVPIVALSANVLSQERDRTICLGADEFHTKPILRHDLHTLCTRFLNKKQQNQQQHRRQPSFPSDLLLFTKQLSGSSSSTEDCSSSSRSSTDVDLAGPMFQSHQRTSAPAQVGATVA